ncbi:MAG: hypothetical protein KJP04_07720 [Arenicella sp.]|nr:hypothetical protein [Arenicella sp.]
MNHQDVNLNPTEFLTAVVENLDGLFFAETREQSKRLFNEIMHGETMPFMLIQLGEAGEIKCDVSLDASKYVGKLNFSNFRKALAMMLMSINQRLKAESDLAILSSRDGDLLFNIPGIVKTADTVNMMVCGMRQNSPGVATVRLLFIDPDAYKQQAE